ncbi:NACHT, LRR and PYD domains-containing protein 3 isoform X20 [Carassius gibelio]|uniref:NACHT, LRR and PYD domains-containing protein 3 isoform X18 n=1 Tax=Carassius gibelio TaxID=101364 RepID=UPI002277BDB5|nr:NACHT, LRR and PYD domains-containing protein 3 isoform X18 [Carassius gibelio]XP_052419184.1 NACHT, LRR and PYD domains-containing protein 3 isoform X19 [Carassius gibelio]XP_052419185.1 NACHT, LRR and PYD domains-containing protein 3 isoform X20 [Carassius gibelio]
MSDREGIQEGNKEDDDLSRKIPRGASPEPSCVSMKSEQSIRVLPSGFSNDHSSKIPRGASSEPICVSKKSDQSIKDFPSAFSVDPSRELPTGARPEPSCVSMKSKQSIKDFPSAFSDGTMTSDTSIISRKRPRGASPEPSCLSMKSNRSIMQPPELSDGAMTSGPRKRGRSASPQSSCMSMKSERSIMQPPELTDKVVTSDPSLKMLSRQNHTCLYWQTQNKTESDLLDETEELQRVKNIHKTSMKSKYESLFEGIKVQENQTLLKSIYTQLYIIEGESEGVNEEHEVLHMEKKPRTQHLKDTPIYCNDIFKALPEEQYQREKIKSVLTKGIAGIGKTVSVQKFILDWAEGTANKDVDFMFVLPFRELNLIGPDHYSLHKLLLDFHPELQDLNSKIYDACKVVFIFDGLDESRMALTFSDDGEKVCDVTENSSVSVLMSNLIKGNLLPSAFIWITSRPAAANRIPSKYIQRVTEIQGFNDAQKEEYFRKRISDEHQASRIISHIRRARSLHIMCHIPVFCWISSTVLENILKQDNEETKIPQTLSEMYIHFLLIQMKMKNQKYDAERDPEQLLQFNKEVIVKLAEVAFKQLMKRNVMFYEEDLRECGIEVTDIASLYSGICTQIFKEESVIGQRKIYCFIHLSFQEFLAAFYAFYCDASKKRDTLQFVDLVYSFLKGAVDKAVESESGHLDLFLRFLLGISLEFNQRLLQDLLTHMVDTSETIKKITEHIKDKIKTMSTSEHISAERSINLFLCLLEVNDQTLYREIEEFVRSDKQSEKKLSVAHCSAIAYMLQVSEEVMDEFDLKKYNTTEEGRRRLIPAVNNCTRALLADCNLTVESCEIIASALQSSNSPLRELDLSNNDLQDSGVKLISDALKSQDCQLHILRLSGCMVSDEGCHYLASALSTNPSHLRELDLSYNHPQHLGVQLLSQRLHDTNYKLETLRLDCGGESRLTLGLKKYSCCLTMDSNTAHHHLALSNRNCLATHVKEKQVYPDHPDRFDEYCNVLSRESLTGRCYWEVEWSGVVYTSIVYKSIKRKGDNNDCFFGYNEKVWTLVCTDSSYCAIHAKSSTDIPAPFPSSRVGVYVDCPAGTLSFYSVSDTHTLTHLHTFNTTFTQPLHAGFGLHPDSSVCFC